jgi:hypothetical protein
MCQFRHSLALCLVFLLAPVQAHAAPELNPDYPERYVVQSGDTLWDIAGRFLREPWRWTEIWRLNPEIGDPDLIYPGDVLRMTFEQGAPRLVREGGVPREVKLSPRVRSEPLTRAVPAIPIDAIQQFLTRPQVLSPAELDAAPQVTAFVKEHIVGGGGDQVYASRLDDDYVRTFDVVRPGQALRDPDTGEYLGQEALYVGSAQLLRAGTPAKLVLAETERQVLLGDRLLADSDEEALVNFHPLPGPMMLEGKIMSVLDGVNQIGQFNVVTLNKGADDGLEPGHVLQVLQRSSPPRNAARTAFWRTSPELPLEEVGLVMVFRTFDRVSYGLVMSATGPIHLLDTVRSPEP